MGKQYGSIADVESIVETKKMLASEAPQPKEKPTYDLSFSFRLMSGTVWFSMSAWGVWIAVYYSKVVVSRRWEGLNIIFSDMYTPSFPVASTAITIHLIGGAYMALAGAVQLVKYIRKVYPAVHRWIGRGYIAAS